MATVLIVLEIEGSQSDAFAVVDALLDTGFLQDAINDHEVEDAGPLRVTSALSMAEKDSVLSDPYDPETAGTVLVDSGAGYREITEADVAKFLFVAFGRTWRTEDFIGWIMTRDVGKRVFLRGGVLQVENDAQLAARLASERKP